MYQLHNGNPPWRRPTTGNFRPAKAGHFPKRMAQRLAIGHFTNNQKLVGNTSSFRIYLRIFNCYRLMAPNF